MKIAVFGASGNIGRIFSELALKEGHLLNLYIRKTTGLPVSPNVKVVTGELTDFDKIKEAISGTDAVVSLLGPAIKRNYPGTPIATGHELIIRSMKELGISRFVTIATPSVRFEKDKASITTIFPRIMGKLLLPKPYQEVVAAGEATRNSGLDWTVVRFIAPVDGKPKGNVKVSFGDKKLSFSITRTDIAAFVLNELIHPQFIRSMPIIGS